MVLIRRATDRTANGDEIHYPLRWVLSEHDDMVGVFYTFREAKANA